ncbi:hypothetical protein F4818DRAFT_410099 [Hypoxylon cercidicola]|nr:hypothetical protein F4818DRAFT_410099 [Hypoxylon cercidicola]
MSLGIDLLAASEEDGRRAALVDFGPSPTDDDDASMGRKALAKPLFSKPALPIDDEGNAKKKKKTKLKSEVAAAQMRDSLVSEIVGNTRVAQDPFLSIDRGSGENAKGTSRILGIKRKRPGPEVKPRFEEQNEAMVEKGRGESEPSNGQASLSALVEYDSD